MEIVICLLVISIISVIIGLYLYKYTLRWIENYKKEQFNEIKQQLTEQAENNITDLTKRIASLTQEIELKKQFNENMRTMREEELDRIIEAEKKNKLNQINNEIKDWAKSAQEAAAFESERVQEIYRGLEEGSKRELSLIKAEVNEYKSKRDAINQEIVRARAIEEQQEFYRVQIDENSLADIQILSNIKKELRKVDLLDKLIYDNYINKPVNEMIKRVLHGDTCSGIYKITRLKTGEVYIGRTTDIKARWQGHAKTAFHCGTISHTMLHTLLEKDGIQNFTWEVVEEVPKDQLNEREKYWINFYDSKRFGMNEKEGG